jgi:hypothetical protein
MLCTSAHEFSDAFGECSLKNKIRNAAPCFGDALILQRRPFPQIRTRSEINSGIRHASTSFFSFFRPSSLTFFEEAFFVYLTAFFSFLTVFFLVFLAVFFGLAAFATVLAPFLTGAGRRS